MRSMIAYITYSISTFMFVWLITKLYTCKLIKEKDKLEKTLKKRTTL